LIGAIQAIPLPTGVAQITCHVATLYWAARAAQDLGLTSNKTPLERLMAINDIKFPKDVLGPQNAMLKLTRSGTWDFTRRLIPPAGTVLLWTEPPRTRRSSRKRGRSRDTTTRVSSLGSAAMA
jgi:hypothetical protein